jgi:hypothetical protein
LVGAGVGRDGGATLEAAHFSAWYSVITQSIPHASAQAKVAPSSHAFHW